MYIYTLFTLLHMKVWDAGSCGAATGGVWDVQRECGGLCGIMGAYGGFHFKLMGVTTITIHLSLSLYIYMYIYI